MCQSQAQGGQRCFGHAKKRFQKATVAAKKNPTEKNTARLATAATQYASTPRGEEDFRAQHEAAVAQSRTDEAAELDRYIQQGLLIRERNAAIKASWKKPTAATMPTVPATRQHGRGTVTDVPTIGSTAPPPVPAAPLVIPDSVQWCVDEIDMLMESIEFEDHSSTQNPHGDGWITLAHMTHPDVSGNNCHAATWEVNRTLVEDVGSDDGVEYSTAEIVFNDGVHWANVVETPQGTFVVDYTARQFSDQLPFPYVTTLDEWQRVITSRATDRLGSQFQELVRH